MKKKTIQLFSFVLIMLIITPVFSASFINKIETNSLQNNPFYSADTAQNSSIEESTCYAIIIGIEEYIHDITADRTTIDETTIDIYQELLNGKNWNENNTRLLLNKNATKHNIKHTIINWLDPLESQHDIVLIYFIGKTKKQSENSLYAAQTITYCADSKNTEDTNDKITDTELDSWLDELESNHIGIILDTSYAHHMNAVSQQGRMILKATSLLSPRINPTDPLLDRTIFTHFTIKGLTGFADHNENGFISIHELFTYTKEACIKHSFDTFIQCIKQRDFQYRPLLPSLSNRHFGDFTVFKLPFGWKRLTNDGFGQQSNYATRGMAIFNNELYIGTQNNLLPQFSKTEEEQMPFTAVAAVPDFYHLFGDLTTIPSRIAMHAMTFVSNGCEIWKYNSTTDTLTKVIGKGSQSAMDPGFGSHFNAAAAVMHVFKDALYVGTWNTPLGSLKNPLRKGCELWRTKDGLHWEQVVGHQAPYTKGGFGNPDNTGAWSIKTFQDHLYVGTMNWDFSDTGGCEVWRTKDGMHWEQVVDHGFRPFMNQNDRQKEAINTYAWAMEIYQGALYMGTFNSRAWLFDEQGTGGQLWRTTDGTNWEKVDLPNGLNSGYQDGFGEGENYGIRRMVVYKNELYIGVASSFFHTHGCEIWKYDGTNWTPVISDELKGIPATHPQYDGFGNTMNKYVWSMVVTTDDKLWIGTGNGQVYLPLLYTDGKPREYFTTQTEGCEIWCYDGTSWEPVIKNQVGLKPNGLGDSTNLGARSMIEYPENSGNIIVGTFKLFNSETTQVKEGCELWMRYTVP